MTTNTAIPLPPHRHHTSTQITPARALTLLTTYLNQSTTNASLHPNALLTEGGPKIATSSSGGVLHNLQRIQAGLRGERVGGDISFGEEEEEGDEGGAEMMRGGEGEGGRKVDGGGGWQDREEFEREQEGLEEGGRGGVMARDGGVEGGGAVPRVKGMRREHQGDGADVMRERRKREKKERKKTERRMADKRHREAKMKE